MLSENDKSYFLRILIFHSITRRLKFRNTVVLLSYFNVKLVILAKKAVIKELLKSKLKELNLSSYLKLKHSVLEENLRKLEKESLKNLSKNHDIIVHKSDKVNSAVVLDKKVYLEKMNEMLNKNKQFLKLFIQEEKH